MYFMECLASYLPFSIFETWKKKVKQINSAAFVKRKKWGEKSSAVRPYESLTVNADLPPPTTLSTIRS